MVTIISNYYTNSITKRRHSFSSFLNAKYGKAAIADDDDDDNKFLGYKRSTTIAAVNNNHLTNRILMNGIQSKPNQIKKGHRPRSYSE